MPSVLLMLVVTWGADPVPAAALFDARSRTAVSIQDAAERLASADVVFFGESHDNAAGHAAQLKTLRALHKRRPDLVLSLEMFEQDAQGPLDDYLAGRVPEAEFLQHSRPWKNYAAHYRPLVEYARERKLPVLAANIPRRVAQAVSQGREPAEADRVFWPRSTTAPQDDYWRRFQAVMRDHAGAAEPAELERYYRAQCLKDDAMAEAIVACRAARPHRPPLVLHLCGNFHCDYGLGAAQRARGRRPLWDVKIVSMEETADPAKFPWDEHAERAHYLLLLPPGEAK